jgi:AsmA protein
LAGSAFRNPAAKDEFAALDSARVAVAVMPLLSKQVQVQRIEVAGLKATLVKHKDGTLNIADLVGRASATKPPAEVGAGGTASTPMQLDIAGIKVSNAQFTWRDEKAGSTTAAVQPRPRHRPDPRRQRASTRLDIDALSLAATGKTGADAFELKLEAPALSSRPEKSGGESLSLSATLAGSGRSVAAKLVLSGVEGNPGLKIGKLALELDAKAGEASAQGPPRFAGCGQPRGADRGAGKSRRQDRPRQPADADEAAQLPLAGKLRADLAHKSAALELGTQFDESKIAPNSMSPSSRRWRWASTSTSTSSTWTSTCHPPKPAKEEKAAKDDKLDFSALKGLDIDGAIRIGALQVSKLKLNKLNATLNMAGGRLDVAPLSVNLYEGTATGSLSLNANGNHLALKQNLAGVSINPLMKDLADKDLLEGRGNVALDVSSHGDSVAAMKKALGGTASLSLKDGAIKGINLAQACATSRASSAPSKTRRSRRRPATRPISRNSARH